MNVSHKIATRIKQAHNDALAAANAELDAAAEIALRNALQETNLQMRLTRLIDVAERFGVVL